MANRKWGAPDPSSPRRGRWSQAEIARLRELYGLRDDESIARELGRSAGSVIAHRLRFRSWPSFSFHRPASLLHIEPGRVVGVDLEGSTILSQATLEAHRFGGRELRSEATFDGISPYLSVMKQLPVGGTAMGGLRARRSPMP